MAAAFPLSKDDVRAIVYGCATRKEADSPTRTDPDLPCVVAIGAFDGLHLGHRRLIEGCMRDARDSGCRSVVVTFNPDPSEVLKGDDAEPRLLSVADRVAFCTNLGIDEVQVIPFTPNLSGLTPKEFIACLQDRLGDIVAMHVGINFRFGVRGSGTIETLKDLGEVEGFSVMPYPLLSLDDAVVSSTRIRALLGEGKVAEAARLLGRYHFVRGNVAHGRGEGTAFGFPTANVCCGPHDCMPCEGVYACIVTDGHRAWPAAANVGAPPTFSDHRDAFLEANLIGFEGDLYGRDLMVIFVEWLRASRPFSSLEELERVVLGNIDWVRHNIGDSCVEVVP